MSPVLIIPMSYLAVVVQACVASRWTGSAPDFVALVAICWLVTGRRGVWAMALAGLVADLNSPGPLGIATAVFFATGQLLIWLRGRVQLEGFFGNCCQAWIASTGISLLLGIAARCQGFTQLDARALVQQCVLVGLSTFAVSLPWLVLANFSHGRGAKSALLVEG